MSKQRPIVLFSNSTWNLWKFRYGLIAFLISKYRNVYIIGPFDSYAEYLRDMGCTLVPLSINRKGLNPLQDLCLLIKIFWIFLRLRPACVLTYTIKPVIYGGFVARILRIPVLPTITGLGTAFINQSLLTRLVISLYKISIGTSSIVFFQNRDDRDVFQCFDIIHEGQARLVPGSGINVVDFPFTPMHDAGQSPIFLMIARLIRDKGIYEYIKAATYIKKIYPNAVFRLLGPFDPGNATAITEDNLQPYIDQNIIDYLGSTDDVRPMIAAADVVVLPSYREGLPRSLLEAGAIGRPSITTDVPGCRDVICHQQNGFLCQARDDKDLAEKMILFIEMPQNNREAMGKIARQRIEEKFSETNVIDIYQAAISKFLSEP